MRYRPSLRLACDMVVLSLLAMAYLYCSVKLNNFLTRSWDTGLLRTFDFGWSLVPVIAAYGFLRIFSGPISSGLALGCALFGVSYANFMKYGLTTQPIAWNDVWNTANLSIINGYFSHAQIVALCVVLVLCVFLAFLLDHKMGALSYSRGRTASACLAVAATLTLSIIPVAAHGFSKSISEVLDRAGLPYIAHDWAQNISLNGLSVHLVQTSTRFMPPRASRDEITKFQKLAASAAPTRTKHLPTVVAILCEACWTDGSHFAEAFSPLMRLGFTDIRGVSPVYGGGTVNASYEMITGLPSHSKALTGMIYQEYSAVIDPNAYTIPGQLRKKGYRTIAMHNHNRRFWRRDIVNPKFGFDKFYGIEDMKNVSKTGWWADDGILFANALEQLVRHKDEEVFLHLATVNTHGSYKGAGTDGVEDYRARLTRTIAQIADFASAVLKSDPDAMILIYADHKPQLTHWFAENDVLPKSVFTHIGDHPMDVVFSPSASKDLIGDVPVYVFGGEANAKDRFALLAEGKPFYCISGYFATEMLKIATPAHSYGRRACDRYREGDYDASVATFPDWLVSLSILGY